MTRLRLTYCGAAMNFMYPAVAPANVLVRYDNVGLGYAGIRPVPMSPLSLP